MTDIEIKHISPSSSYYWEKCPLKALFYYKYKGVKFFPVSPDANLGSIIHKFQEKKAEWSINSGQDFENNWTREINNQNKKYLEDDLQKRFYPIQWSSSFYGVKKQLLKKQLLKQQPLKTETGENKLKLVFEEWINN